MRDRAPIPAVDVIIEYRGGVVLIERKNPPYGWAIPGGFIEYGESAESAAVREAKEETSLDVKLVRQLKTYSDPERDPRRHTISIVFVAHGFGTLQAADDAKHAEIFRMEKLPAPLAFDHARVLADYFLFKAEGKLSGNPA